MELAKPSRPQRPSFSSEQHGPSLLYVPMLSYSGPPFPPDAVSAHIGFGRTSSSALVKALIDTGLTVHIAPASHSHPGSSRQAAQWLYDGYIEILDAVDRLRPSAILLFHSFSHFAAELRRSLFDLGLNTPIATFAHGSHWDVTDRFRAQHYPGLELAELANFTSVDRLYCPSKYMRRTIFASIERLNPTLRQSLEPRTKVLGIPVPPLVDPQSLPPKRNSIIQLIYNHSLIPSKRPDVFVKAALHLLGKYKDLRIVITRDPQDTWGDEVVAPLRVPRVTFAGNLSIENYHRYLVTSDIQISTAEHEGLGVSTLEAMSAGVCCLVPNRGSYPELMARTPEALYDGSLDGLIGIAEQYIQSAGARSGLASRQQKASTAWSAVNIARILLDDMNQYGGRPHQPFTGTRNFIAGADTEAES
jgi:glycosyltransferase involved in cell wall biosynthesis